MFLNPVDESHLFLSVRLRQNGRQKRGGLQLLTESASLEIFPDASFCLGCSDARHGALTTFGSPLDYALVHLGAFHRHYDQPAVPGEYLGKFLAVLAESKDTVDVSRTRDAGCACPPLCWLLDCGLGRSLNSELDAISERHRFELRRNQRLKPTM